MAIAARSRSMGRGEDAAPAGVPSAGWPVLAIVMLLGQGVTTANAQDQVATSTARNWCSTPAATTRRCMALVFTPDGRTLFSGGFDKVIHAWEVGSAAAGGRAFGDDPAAGLAGDVGGPFIAMALSPKADARGKRLLAVSGFGVENQAGNIGLFRVPGSPDFETGEIVVQLPSGWRDEAVRSGHLSTVTSLAFDQAGRLASGSLDGAAILWDVEARRVLAVFRNGRPAARSSPWPSPPTAGGWSPAAATACSASGTSTAPLLPWPAPAFHRGTLRDVFGAADQRAGRQPRRPPGSHRPRGWPARPLRHQRDWPGRRERSCRTLRKRSRRSPSAPTAGPWSRRRSA